MFLIKEIWFNLGTATYISRVFGGFNYYEKKGTAELILYKGSNGDTEMFYHLGLGKEINDKNEQLENVYIMNDKGQTIEKIK